MKQKNSNALFRVTFTAMLRRYVASILLVTVAAVSAFAAMVLQNLTIRQENALSNTIMNTTILCTVTNSKGTDSGNLQMPSSFVEMLEGQRHFQDCYLDDYVKNVRAKTETTLTKPEETTLRRILSIDSDTALSKAEGVSVQFFDGYDEELLKGRDKICLIPSSMLTENGYITIIDDSGESMRLKVIGTITNGPKNAIYCPFFMATTEGGSVAFLTDSCSFDIRSNQNLDESKEYIYEWFSKPSLNNQLDGDSFGVLVHDETYRENISEIHANLSMLRLFLPILIVICGCIGFFASFLATRGRIKEFAVMRCIGMTKSKIFGLVMTELSILALTGFVLGITGGILLEKKIQIGALLNAALMTAVFLLGSVIAVIRITVINVMKLMKAEE